MRRAYKFRAYPTGPQEARATRLLADHCDLYNAALEERREAWRLRQATITYGTQSARLKQIRRSDPDGQGRHSFTAQQQTLRRLNVAFQAFYDRCRAAQQPGYPRFKPRSRFDRVMFVCPVHGPMDADVNAARNVYARAGLGSGQASQAA